jgi:hypothetical protein
MRRREFIVGIGGAAALPLVARAQQPAKPVVGFLSRASPIGWDNYLAGLRDGLRSLGFVEGTNVRRREFKDHRQRGLADHFPEH